MTLLKKFFETKRTYPPLMLRLALGVVIFPHGAQKLLGWFGGFGLEGTMGFFTQQIGLPAFIAFSVIAIEFFGSLGLITGFFTRFSAAGIASVMTGAIATAHWSNGFFMNWSGKQAGEGFEFHLLVLGMALALIVSGGGKFSLDQWISEKFLKKSISGSPSGTLALSTQ